MECFSLKISPAGAFVSSIFYGIEPKKKYDRSRYDAVLEFGTLTKQDLRAVVPIRVLVWKFPISIPLFVIWKIFQDNFDNPAV